MGKLGQLMGIVTVTGTVTVNGTSVPVTIHYDCTNASDEYLKQRCGSSMKIMTDRVCRSMSIDDVNKHINNATIPAQHAGRKPLSDTDVMAQNAALASSMGMSPAEYVKHLADKFGINVNVETSSNE